MSDKRRGAAWETIVTSRLDVQEGVDGYALQLAINNFHALGDDPNFEQRPDVEPIMCTGGRLWRGKSSRPHGWMLKYRSIIAIVKYSEEKCQGGIRGKLFLLAVWRRDAETYNAERLRRLIVNNTRRK